VHRRTLGGNLAESPYPDQSLYPVNSVPSVVRRINNALRRADQIQWAEGAGDVDWLVPIVADAEAGFGGPLNAFELMKSMIEAGAAGVHYEDQLSSEKKCGHLGGKSPSFNWKRALGDEAIATFQRRLAAAGYRFQFVTLAGFHAIAASMFGSPRATHATGRAPTSGCSRRAISGGESSTLALVGSTEEAQFEAAEAVA
jgi:isocitrate lyase